jgi:hypothetical protein
MPDLDIGKTKIKKNNKQTHKQTFIAIFNENELELLLSGMPDLDIMDWKNNTSYSGGYNAKSQQIEWFWKAVSEFTAEERAKLLQFGKYKK